MLAKIASLIALGSLAAASPALAEEAPDAAADAIYSAVTADGTDADGAAEFGELFASWEDLEEGGLVTAEGDVRRPPRIDVAVPAGMPVEGVRLTSGYGMRNHPVLGGRRQHNGVDLSAPHGTPVYATADGIVEMAQWYSSYGNYVQIGHGGELETRYAHLSSYTVQPGDAVEHGQLIGYVGSTGRSTGPHLHYEVRVANEAVNPLPYMVAELETSNDARAARGGPE